MYSYFTDLDKILSDLVHIKEQQSGAFYPPEEKKPECPSCVLKTETKNENGKVTIRLFIPGLSKEQVYVMIAGEKILKVVMEREDCGNETKTFDLKDMMLGDEEHKLVFPPKVTLKYGVLTIEFSTTATVEEVEVEIGD